MKPGHHQPADFFLGYFIVLNALGDMWFGRLVAHVFFSLVIVAGVLTTFKQRWLGFVVIVLAVVSLALIWAQEFRPAKVLIVLTNGISLIYLGVLLAVVAIAQVFRDGPVTGHRIHGAIVIYLLLAVLWAFAYQVVALTIPQAFRLPEGVITGDPDATPAGADLLQRRHSYYYRIRRYRPRFTRWPAPWLCWRSWWGSSIPPLSWPGWCLWQLCTKKKNPEILKIRKGADEWTLL